jgi:SAM-dependent methyltransferase
MPGVDLDPRVLENQHLDEAFVADAAALPFEDQSFDLVFHKMVAEHLAEPAAAIAETASILKPGGRLLFETPSRFYYPMLIANLTPISFHRYFVRRFGSVQRRHIYAGSPLRAMRRAAVSAAARPDLGERAQTALTQAPKPRRRDDSPGESG